MKWNWNFPKPIKKGGNGGGALGRKVQKKDSTSQKGEEKREEKSACKFMQQAGGRGKSFVGGGGGDYPKGGETRRDTKQKKIFQWRCFSNGVALEVLGAILFYAWRQRMRQFGGEKGFAVWGMLDGLPLKSRSHLLGEKKKGKTATSKGGAKGCCWLKMHGPGKGGVEQEAKGQSERKKRTLGSLVRWGGEWWKTADEGKQRGAQK